MPRLILLILSLASTFSAHAIVIRDDVDDAQYRIPGSSFPALVDMPGEGHGVLIAPRWIVTAAHVLPMHAPLREVSLAGTQRAVARVVVHPGYARASDELVGQALASGEAVLLVVQIASSDDIALIELAEPVTDVAPVALHAGDTLIGEVVQIVGKGATGTGAAGHDPHGPNRTQLRRAFNTITSAHGRWFCYVFDAPAAALPLEGKTGSGDSGGPVLVDVDGRLQVAGLAAWHFVHGDLRSVRPGLYGQFTCNVRLGHYRDWLDRMMRVQPSARANDDRARPPTQ